MAPESAAAQLEMDQQVPFSGAEVEQSPLQQRRMHNHVCTLMSMLCLIPNMCRVSHSLYVPERVFPLYNKTGIAHFCKNMESPPVAPVPPKCIPRHSRGTPEALPRHCRGTAELAAARRARGPFFEHVLEFANTRGDRAVGRRRAAVESVPTTKKDDSSALRRPRATQSQKSDESKALS